LMCAEVPPDDTSAHMTGCTAGPLVPLESPLCRRPVARQEPVLVGPARCSAADYAVEQVSNRNVEQPSRARFKDA